MSIKALDWAFDQEVFPSSHKFVLVVMANYSSETGKAFPCMKRICQDTSQCEETVTKAISALVVDGFLVDTGKKTGATGQIRVYQLPKVAWEIPQKNGVFGEDPNQDPVKTRLRPQINGVVTLNPEPGTENGKARLSPLDAIPVQKPRFASPTLQEMVDYGKSIDLPKFESERCFFYYESNGWRVGKNPMRKWKAAMQNWKKGYNNGFANGNGHTNGKSKNL